MATINDVRDIDFGSRVVALRAVGAALGVPNASLPSPNMANSSRTYLKFINLFRAFKSLPLLPSLDYSGFQPALNKLLVDAGSISIPVVLDQPRIDGVPPLLPGVQLTCYRGTWDNMPTSYTFTWKRGGTTIGTNSMSYTLVTADKGTTITCIVVATNGGGASAPATSNGLAVPP